MLLGWLGKKVTAEELLRPVFDEHPDLRIGWPDDSVTLRVWSPEKLRLEIRDAVARLRALWPGAEFFADVDVYTNGSRFDLRVGRSRAPAKVPDAASQLEAQTSALRARVTTLGGELYVGHGGTYFHVSLPARGWGPNIGDRLYSIELDEPTWEDIYRAKMERTSWSRLRSEVYRFSKFASAIADWCTTHRLRRVLIPSAGITVDPWLFAARGVEVVATDCSQTALEVMSRPERQPRMYGSEPWRRWDIDERGMYGGDNPDSFGSMPALENEATREELRKRTAFLRVDWAALPLGTASVDAIFATNALPRDGDGLLSAVIAEWARVLRPGGFVFCAMHNFNLSAGREFKARGWQRIDAMHGDAPGTATSFQEYLSSG